MAADLKKAGAAAAELLLSQRLYSLRLDIKALSYDKNIVFDSFSGFCSKTLARLSDLTGLDAMRDGCTVIKKQNGATVYIVLYNDAASPAGRRNFTLAHEVGHIYLGHEDDGAHAEAEANHFAAQLLLAPALVWELLSQSDFILTASELAEVFAVSKAAAQNRLDSLINRPKPDFSETERLLVKKFGGLLPQLNGPLISL